MTIASAMSIIGWTVALWTVLCVGCVVGAWWSGARRERHVDDAYKQGFEQGREWHRLSGDS
ncbi:hypothetical protein EHM76_04855 [bacterium]|nr:MAG: hypothetical protein EHM76_04855 [bacterium]